jgi:hypothetical protein
MLFYFIFSESIERLCRCNVFFMFRELEQAYSTKQVALSVYSQKAQETVDKIFQVRYRTYLVL